ncbi:hypothetical protein KCU83_g143, partial [Aureobasidium melanogenum]
LCTTRTTTSILPGEDVRPSSSPTTTKQKGRPHCDKPAAMNPHQKNKVDINAMSPDEQRLFRMYGKLPDKKNLLQNKLKGQERKYFDSGDYALSKAGKAGDVGVTSIGVEHPSPDTIPHLSSSPSTQTPGNPNGNPGLNLQPTQSHQSYVSGSPVKESSILQRGMSVDDQDGEIKSAMEKRAEAASSGLSPSSESDAVPILGESTWIGKAAEPGQRWKVKTRDPKPLSIVFENVLENDDTGTLGSTSSKADKTSWSASKSKGASWSRALPEEPESCLMAVISLAAHSRHSSYFWSSSCIPMSRGEGPNSAPVQRASSRATRRSMSCTGLCVGLICVWFCGREGRAEDICGLDVEGGCEVVEQRRDICGSVAGLMVDSGSRVMVMLYCLPMAARSMFRSVWATESVETLFGEDLVQVLQGILELVGVFGVVCQVEVDRNAGIGIDGVFFFEQWQQFLLESVGPISECVGMRLDQIYTPLSIDLLGGLVQLAPIKLLVVLAVIFENLSRSCQFPRVVAKEVESELVLRVAMADARDVLMAVGYR